MDGSQPGIPGASAIFASAFQVIEEEADKGSIEVFDPELRGHFAKSFFGKLQKQAEAIAISRYCMRAGLQLTKQAIGGQLGEFSFDIAPGAIPVGQGAGGEPVPHVMQPRTVAATLGAGAEADLLRQLSESVMHYRSGNPLPAFAEKERRSAR